MCTGVLTRLRIYPGVHTFMCSGVLTRLRLFRESLLQRGHFSVHHIEQV